MTTLLLCMALLGDAALDSNTALRGCGYAARLDQVSAIYPVPARVFIAQGFIESGWKARLVGAKGERGPWQVLPQYSSLTPAQLAVPVPGMFEGARHLAFRLKQSRGNIRRALAAYNGGPIGLRAGACRKCDDYADKVLLASRRWR